MLVQYSSKSNPSRAFCLTYVCQAKPCVVLEKQSDGNDIFLSQTSHNISVSFGLCEKGRGRERNCVRTLNTDNNHPEPWLFSILHRDTSYFILTVPANCLMHSDVDRPGPHLTQDVISHRLLKLHIANKLLVP